MNFQPEKREKVAAGQGDVHTDIEAKANIQGSDRRLNRNVTDMGDRPVRGWNGFKFYPERSWALCRVLSGLNVSVAMAGQGVVWWGCRQRSLRSFRKDSREKGSVLELKGGTR